MVRVFEQMVGPLEIVFLVCGWRMGVSLFSCQILGLGASNIDFLRGNNYHMFWAPPLKGSTRPV